MIKITEVFVVIQSIADDEGIGNGETNVVGDVTIASVGFLDE